MRNESMVFQCNFHWLPHVTASFLRDFLHCDYCHCKTLCRYSARFLISIIGFNLIYLFAPWHNKFYKFNSVFQYLSPLVSWHQFLLNIHAIIQLLFFNPELRRWRRLIISVFWQYNENIHICSTLNMFHCFSPLI